MTGIIKKYIDGIRRHRILPVLILVVLFSATFLRISLLVLYPLMVALIFVSLRLQITKYIVHLFLLILVGWLLSFFNGFFLSYNLLSLFYMVPFLLLLLSTPAQQEDKQDWIRLFFYFFSIIALINDIPGIIQVIINSKDTDDHFIGIYSRFSISMNGLAVLNTILFIYYCFSYFSFKVKWHLAAAVFFLTCSVMGFYGGGLLILLLAFSFVFFDSTLQGVLKSLLAGTILLMVIMILLFSISPRVLNYNKNNLEKAQHFSDTTTPRKIVSFYNYFSAYPSHIRDFLFGSGPGTFNSRSAFMIGSAYYFTSLPAIKSDKKPPYFRDYAYPLWNNTNTSQELYQDGFRNQPFSSLLAFLGEYGLLFTLLFILYVLLYYKKVVPARPTVNMSPRYYLYSRLFKCFLVMLLLLMIIDNYLEYPEITLLLTFILKLLHIEIKKFELHIIPHK